MSVWRTAWLVAKKDLRIEGRSRVTLGQVLPFGAIVLLLFAFALDPDRGLLDVRPRAHQWRLLESRESVDPFPPGHLTAHRGDLPVRCL